MAEVPELPDDVWEIILSKLTYYDRIRIMGVCRQWRDCGYADTSTSLIWQVGVDIPCQARQILHPMLSKVQILPAVAHRGRDDKMSRQEPQLHEGHL